MFELIQSISFDVDKGVATGKAWIPREHPLFQDHFPGQPVLPGSWLIELSAQVAGPLAEELVRSKFKTDKWAVLAMIRHAKFHRPAILPVNLDITAESGRVEPNNVTLKVSAVANGALHLTAEVVMMMMEGSAEWQEAITARNERIRRWVTA